jgi:hypothetical protein
LPSLGDEVMKTMKRRTLIIKKSEEDEMAKREVAFQPKKTEVGQRDLCLKET